MSEKRKNSNKSLLPVIGVIAVVVVVAVAAIIALQASTNADVYDYSDIPMSRTADGAFLLGNPDARLTVVAFEDFLCPHCQTYQTELKQFFDEYVATGQANFEFRMTPVFGAPSEVVFSLAECANELEDGRFWEAHDRLFNIASSRNWDTQAAREFASQMEMSYGELLECSSTADQYRTDFRVAQSYEAFTGTPAVGYRLDGGDIQLAPLTSTQPSAGQLGLLVQTFGS